LWGRGRGLWGSAPFSLGGAEMPRTFALLLVVFALLACVAGAASAGTPDPDKSFVTLTKTDPDGMATCPALDAAPYEYVQVDARRSNDTPIQGIPYTSFFFTVIGGSVNITNVDTETDVNGQIRFRADDAASLALGSVTIECQIYTVVLNDSDVLEVNSYDVSGDGGVDGTDFGMFVSDFGVVPVRKRSDFNWSGAVDGTDFGYFVSHFGH
jgi:hypothetical protein